jgi:soluble lytic murein transglycosylase
MLHRTRRVAQCGVAAALLATTPFSAQAPPELWLAPASRPSAADAAIARAVVDLADGKAEAALPVFAKSAADPVIGGYALLHIGRAQLALENPEAAAEAAERLVAKDPSGYLLEAGLWLAADAAEALEDWRTALDALDRLWELKTPGTPAALLRIGRAAVELKDDARARTAFTTLYYEHALASEATAAAAELRKIDPMPPRPTRDRFVVELGRAERLFGARRFRDVCPDYRALHGAAAGDERRLVDLRLAQCEFQLGRHASALKALRPHVDAPGPRQPEAKYYYLSTMRMLGRQGEYVALVGRFVDDHPADALAEAALNELGTHYILADEDEQAARVFADQYARFPQGVFAERSAWKAGWWAFKTGELAEAARIFQSAATTHQRSNYRPAWLYWAARSHGELGDREAAIDGYETTIRHYRNLYHGRLAMRELEELQAPARPPGAAAVSPASRVLPPSVVPGAPPRNTPLVQRLLSAGMYDDAIGELRAAQRESGPSPLIDATIAYAYHRKGDLRPAINTMRRAYPQFMAAGGEALPRDILTVIFPVDYWELISRQAVVRKLDPFLMVALVAQESTFQPAVRSSANAYGMMQIIPATGRRFAQALRIRPWSTARLTDPEVNVRIGMTYFRQLLDEFGDPAPALAAYNAGEHRVREWLAERPKMDRDVFIEDIPFPETQNYVKRILGTAEDYRQLYRHLTPGAGSAPGR